ncbi:hypothetical protein ACF0H5_000215 [Mactra antiquata]
MSEKNPTRSSGGIPNRSQSPWPPTRGNRDGLDLTCEEIIHKVGKREMHPATWQRSIDAVLKQINLFCNETKHRAQDRARWKTMPKVGEEK